MTKDNLQPRNYSDIDLYNYKVNNWHIPKDKELITATAIKLFNDRAQKENWNDKTYNEQVETFNNLHGYLIHKRGNGKVQAKNHDYYYINYPMIDKKAFAETMTAYRKHIGIYNAKIKQLKKQNPAETRQTVKPFSEMVFESLLRFYAGQLKDRNLLNVQLGTPTSIERLKPPRLRIDTRKVAKHRIDGIERLGVAKKTVFNHLKRLQEAGILTDYQFTNANKPIYMRIAPEILTISEGKTPQNQSKNKNSENQFFKSNPSKVLPHNKDMQEPFLLKKDKKKDIADNASKKDFVFAVAPQPTQEQFCKNTGLGSQPEDQPDEVEQEQVIAAKIRQKFKQIDPHRKETKNQYQQTSDNLRSKILTRHNLAQLLAQRAFDDYAGLRYDTLRQEVLYGNLTRDEFKELLIQDFFKSASKIYRYRRQNIVAGLWMTTLNDYADLLFKHTNGYDLTKDMMLEKLPEYRWRIGMAQRLFGKYGIEPMIPTHYFDPTRIDQKDLGFRGTQKLWQSHLKYLSEKEKRAKKRLSDFEHRKAKNSQIRKLERRINTYLKGNISLEDLTTYAQTTLDHEVLMQLPGVVKAMQAKHINS